MKTLVEIRFGSQLDGTSTPESDIDLKSASCRRPTTSCWQRVKTTINNKRPKQPFEKNVAGDVDQEAYALHRYLSLLAEGQTVALDMLFAPEWAMTMEPVLLWQEIVVNRHRLLSRRASSFLGYCRTQANKYGIKGSRVHAVRNIVEWFDAAIAEMEHPANRSLRLTRFRPSSRSGNWITRRLFRSTTQQRETASSFGVLQPEGAVFDLAEGHAGDLRAVAG